MKRSEIISVIQDTLIDEGDLQPISDYLAQCILTKLEEAGIQPPAIKEPCETHVLYQGRYVKTDDSFIFTHKWDEE